jgi:hypothetical protein
MLCLAVGTTTSWSGISDNSPQLDQFTDHTSVETPLICMTVISSLELTQIPDNYNCGTSVPVNQSKTSLGMKVFLLRKHAKFMVLSSKRTQEISLLQEVVVPTRSKYLMETICSSHALKSKILVELLSLSISAIKETCLLVVVETVSSEFSML